MLRPTLANGLSLLRVLLAVPTYWCVAEGYWLAASLLLAAAIASDMADGPIARRRHQDSAAGGLLDHSCDAVFVATVLFALAMATRLPMLLPVLVLASFAQYVLDSKALSGQQLRTNKLGRANGIAYFVLPTAYLFSQAAAADRVPQDWFLAAAWLLIGSTLLSMLDRLWTLFRLRAAP